MVTVFSFRSSIHSHLVPSFLGSSTIGAAHELSRFNDTLFK